MGKQFENLYSENKDTNSISFCDNCGKEISDFEVKYYTSQSGMKLKLCENCYNNHVGKSKRRKNKVKKLTAVIIT